MKLKVCCADNEDVYRDIVRVPEKHRLGPKGCVIVEGSVCEIATGGRSAYGILRGYDKSSDPIVRIDERMRNRLGIKVGEEVDVSFRVAGLWGQFRWAWNASDPAYRVAARLGLLSVVLGLLGLLLGLVSLAGGR